MSRGIEETWERVAYGCFKPMEKFGSACHSAKTVDIVVASHTAAAERVNLFIVSSQWISWSTPSSIQQIYCRNCRI